MLHLHGTNHQANLKVHFVQPIITWTAWLAAVAALIHAGCFGVAFRQWTQNSDSRLAVYELYKPAFVVNSTLTSSFQKQLRQSCPRADLNMLTMQADFVAPDTTTKISINGAWIPVRSTPFGFVYINGYHLLLVIFGISCLAQLNVLWEYRLSLHNQNFDFFEQPCAARWLEYAFTSPSMITIIATCLAIRDMYTILLLSAAQGALVQYGFAMECAYSLRVFEGKQDQNTDNAVAFRPLPLIPMLRTLPRISQLLWYWSFMPSTLLHALVWGILISSFLDQTKIRCYDIQAGAPDWLVAILIAQAVLFTLFMVVAVWQAFKLDMIPFRKKKPISEDIVKHTFRVTFLWYTILSAVAKAMLGITYLTYVNQFPFYTPA